MKPVTLKISGLQSYRELQTIDFTVLCEGGVFGIFGPTGSGKSTILDALTLALYGKVERASGGTQGIMNQSEDKLYVSFTFELSEPGGRVSYQVERQFKRTNELSIATSACRLTRFDVDGEHVLADKGTDVNQKIEQLLGLSMQDFTRAVVLPQGKFAEFLSLKGSERRQMLQRLFNLEQYGDQLQMKLSQKVKQTDILFKQQSAKLEGLGEASAETVEAAKTRLKEAESRRQEALERQRGMEASYERMKAIRGYQLEREHYIKQLSELTQQEEAIRSKELRVSQAEAASGLEPYWKRWKDTEKRSREAERDIKQAEEAKRLQDQAFLQIQQQVLDIQQLRQREEPKLLEDIQRFKQAVELESELSEHMREEKRLSQSHEQYADQLGKQQQELAQLQDLLKRAAEKQNRLKEEWKNLETDALQRRRIRDAFKDKLPLQTLETVAHTTGAEYAKLKERLNEAERIEAEDAAAVKLHSEQVSQHMLQLLEELGYLLSARQQLESFILQGPSWLERLERERLERERERLAAELAAQLADGEPCPVCGSTHHPELAGDDRRHPLDGVQSSDEMHRLREALDTCRALLTDNKSLEKEAERLLAEMRNHVSGGDFPQAEDGMIAEAAPAAEQLDVHAVLDNTSWMEQFAATERVVDRYRSSLPTVLDDCRQALQRYTEFQWQARERRLLKEALMDSERESNDRQQKAATQLKLAIKEWAEKYEPFTFEEIDAVHAAMEEKEQQSEELRKRLDTSIEFLETKREQLQQLKEAFSVTEKQCLEASTRLQGIRQLISEKSKRLQDWCGLLEPRKALSEAETRYDELKQKEQELLVQQDAARAAVSQADNAFSRAEEAGSRLQEEKSRTEKEWLQALESSPFNDEAVFREALSAPEEIQRWAAEIKQFRETHQQLLLKIKDLEIKLGEDRVSEEQWVQMTEQLHSVKAQVDSLLSEQAKAERDVEELSAKHTLWLQLRKAADETKHVLDQYAHLQTILRGNAFVEYIAEEQMMQVSRLASERLGQLTRGRYAIEVDSAGGFIIRDQHNGGLRRPVSTLSGGETFLTSLALALALSSQIQLRGQFPLEFFFLDEGFGTLDPDLLETVVNALEKLRNDHVSVGVISHVPELRARLPRKLIVTSANDTGLGSRVHLEAL
ncbi:AAA family ATPase [Marinicrinis lubricantis]|uniref:Nuclease SbcCD subunit C n=1 Tax=Marinicrinis lubricantis TaxID=2086470 RepID=A0ABW1IUP5_9BACL